MTTEAIVALVLTVGGGLAGLVLALVGYINRLHRQGLEEFTKEVKASFKTIEGSINQLRDKVDQRHEDTWRTIGRLEADLKLAQAEIAHLKERQGALDTEMERRLAGMHSKVNEVTKYGSMLEKVARDLKRASGADS